MKIALLTDGIYPYVIGGMQKFAYHLVKQLVKNGHEVYLFHCNDSKLDPFKLEFFTETERKHIHAIVIPVPHKLPFPGHYIVESYRYSRAIYNALQPLLPEIDFVLAQGFCAWALFNDKNRNPFPRVAVHFYGLEMYQQIPSLKSKIAQVFLRPPVKKNIQKADYTISLGGKITSLLKKISGKTEIWTSPIGIDPSWLTTAVKQRKGATRFLYVGRYERRKSLPEINAAIEKLSAQYDFTFEFIGDIPKNKRISDKHTKYHGKVPPEVNIKDIISQCDVLVCPSYSEGMPTVIMEAMACGLAIIATDVGAVSDLVDKSNGWIIDTPKPAAIAEAMTLAINETDELLSSKKINSLNKIKNCFLLEDATASLIAKMESVAQAKALNSF